MNTLSTWTELNLKDIFLLIALLELHYTPVFKSL